MNMRHESSDRNESNIVVVRVVNVTLPMIPIADSRNLNPSIYEASHVVFDHDRSK